MYLSVVISGAYLVVHRYMFLHPRRGLMSRGPTAQTVNGDITVRAPGLSSSAVPVLGLRPSGLS